jgi:hypothetical protein
MSLTPRDLDFMEAKNSAAREIALAIGVPPMLLGIPGDNTYANYQEANRAFWRQTVLPLVARTARALTGWLAPAYGAHLRLSPDLDQVEALAPEREALWARMERTSFLTDAEKRAAVGYGPKQEGGDSATRPFALQPKFNPNHDAGGRFDFKPDGAEVTPIAGRPGGHRPHHPKPHKPNRPPKEPKPPKPATPTPPADSPKPLNDVLLPGGKQIGERRAGAGDGIRTAAPAEFDRIQAELLNGAKPVTTPTQYGGQWYERPDGTAFGIRESSSGPVVEVTKSNDPVLKPGYKVHRK